MCLLGSAQKAKWNQSASNKEDHVCTSAGLCSTIDHGTDQGLQPRRWNTHNGDGTDLPPCLLPRPPFQICWRLCLPLAATAQLRMFARRERERKNGGEEGLANGILSVSVEKKNGDDRDKEPCLIPLPESPGTSEVVGRSSHLSRSTASSVRGSVQTQTLTLSLLSTLDATSQEASPTAFRNATPSHRAESKCGLDQGEAARLAWGGGSSGPPPI